MLFYEGGISSHSSLSHTGSYFDKLSDVWREVAHDSGTPIAPLNNNWTRQTIVLLTYVLIYDYYFLFFVFCFGRNEEAVDFDVDRFMKDMESVMKFPGSEETGSDEDIEEGSSSDMDFGKS